MVTRQIEKAQKKVEEQHFEARKNLLEYDEVMDHQRKRVYGFRQEILDGINCKLSILEMIDEQIDTNVDRLMAPDYGPSSFAEFADERLGRTTGGRRVPQRRLFEACQICPRSGGHWRADRRSGLARGKSQHRHGRERMAMASIRPATGQVGTTLNSLTAI